MRAAVILLVVSWRLAALPAIVQSGNNWSASSATSINVVFGSSNTAGNCLIAATIHDPGANSSIVSDTQGNVWRHALNSTLFFNALDFWSSANAHAGANTVTVTNTGSGQDFIALAAAEVSGLTNCTVDQTSEKISSLVTNWDSGSKTTLADGELIIGYGTFQGPPSGTATVGAGFTQLENIDGDVLEYFVQGSKGSISATFAANNAVNGYAYMVTLYSAAPTHHSRIF